VEEARLAVSLCKRYGLDGYIANAEAPYEGPANYWKTPAFLKEFRRLAPHAPLALSYIGDGNPHRDFPIWDWEDEGAALMPQCYWSDMATSIWPSWHAAVRANLDSRRLVYSLGTSGFAQPYPTGEYVQELNLVPWRQQASFNVWLLESTTDDVLRALAQVRR
jgi:hypothetical protein